MSNKTELQNNNLELQGILADVNALPDAGSGSAPTLVNVIFKNYSSSGEYGVYYTTYSAKRGLERALLEMGPGETHSIDCVNSTVLLVDFYGNQFSCDACSGKVEYINHGREFYAFYVDDSEPAYLNGAQIDFS